METTPDNSGAAGSGDPTPKKLALIGVTGPKSGPVLIDHLTAHRAQIDAMFPGGITVICGDHSDTRHAQNQLGDINIKRGDIAHVPFLTDAFADVDTVIHIAGIHWSRQVVEAAVARRVRRLILIHTTGVYSKYKEAGAVYRETDAYVERLCAEHGIVLTILRPTMIYGNTRDGNIITFVKMVDRLPVMPVVRGARYDLQPVHYADLAQAYFDVLMSEDVTGGKHYNLSGGEVIQLREALRVMGEQLGKRVRFVSFPFWFAYGGAVALWRLTRGRNDFRERVQRLCESRTYSHAEATADFGYAPRSFREGIVGEILEYRAEQNSL